MTEVFLDLSCSIPHLMAPLIGVELYGKLQTLSPIVRGGLPP